MNYIIEGSDAVGKTATIEILKDVLDYPVVKGSSFEQSANGNEALYNKFSQFAKFKNTIFDRFIYSNLVYADIYDDYSIITNKQARKIEDEIREKSKVIYLYADLEVVEQRLLNRGDDYVKADMLKLIRYKYEEVLEQSSLDIVRIDTADIPPLEVAAKILSS